MKRYTMFLKSLVAILGNQRGEVAIAGEPSKVDKLPAKGESDGPVVVAPVVDPVADPVVEGDEVVDDKFDFESLPESAQKYIKSLRTESADNRTKNNNLSTRLESIEGGLKQMFGGEEGQELSTEDQLSQMQTSHEDLAFNNALTNLAYENGVPMANFEYFSFLMNKSVDGLEEGQELSEENLLGIIQKSKSFVGEGSTDSSNTSVKEDGSGSKDPNANVGITLDSFLGMSLTQKSELYIKNPTVYNQFMKQARDKRLLK